MRVLIIDDGALDAVALVEAISHLVPPAIGPDPWEDFFRRFRDPEYFRAEGVWRWELIEMPTVKSRASPRPVHSWRAAHYMCDRLRLGGTRKEFVRFIA
jgi:hypothetical protein